MAAIRRSKSLELDLNFSKSTKNLMRHAASFISAFDVSEPRMRQIVGEFHKIVDEVKKMQEKTDEQRRAGAFVGGVGGVLGLMILAAPFTGGASLLAGLAAAAGGGAAAAAAAAVGGGAAAAAAVGGGAVVVEANLTKKKEENKSVHKVEELGKEFMEIVESLKINLEEIKMTCEELKTTSMKVQAAVTLSDMVDFQRMLTEVSELAETSGEVLGVAVAVMAVMRDLLVLIVSVFRVTATPEEDQKLRDSIRQSADQCQKVVNGFEQMKVELRHFTRRWRYKTRSRSITV